MSNVASLFVVFAAAAAAQNDPNAKCPNARPSGAQCCYTNKTNAVMGGIDFVDLALNQKNMTGEAAYGSSSITAELNGYTFNFLTEANKQAFTQDPWSFAPAWGGF